MAGKPPPPGRGGPVWRGPGGGDTPRRGGPVWRGRQETPPPRPATAPEEPGEIILEFRPHGTIMKVSAVDVASGTEVWIQAPASTSRQELEDIAIAKLKYVLAQKRGDG